MRNKKYNNSHYVKVRLIFCSFWSVNGHFFTMTDSKSRHSNGSNFIYLIRLWQNTSWLLIDLYAFFANQKKNCLYSALSLIYLVIKQIVSVTSSLGQTLFVLRKYEPFLTKCNSTIDWFLWNFSQIKKSFGWPYTIMKLKK